MRQDTPGARAESDWGTLCQRGDVGGVQQGSKGEEAAQRSGVRVIQHARVLRLFSGEQRA
jgi:hypothetical protein